MLTNSRIYFKNKIGIVLGIVTLLCLPKVKKERNVVIDVWAWVLAGISQFYFYFCRVGIVDIARPHQTFLQATL